MKYVTPILLVLILVLVGMLSTPVHGDDDEYKVYIPLVFSIPGAPYMPTPHEATPRFTPNSAEANAPVVREAPAPEVNQVPTQLP